jgi:hypothetical protein
MCGEESQILDLLFTQFTQFNNFTWVPTTVAPAGTSFTITAPAPTIASSPMVTPGIILAPIPI